MNEFERLKHIEELAKALFDYEAEHGGIGFDTLEGLAKFKTLREAVNAERK